MPSLQWLLHAARTPTKAKTKGHKEYDITLRLEAKLSKHRNLQGIVLLHMLQGLYRSTKIGTGCTLNSRTAKQTILGSYQYICLLKSSCMVEVTFLYCTIQKLQQ